MANQPYSRLQRSYPVIETTFGVAASAPVNGDCCLITTLTGDCQNPEIVRPDKTGSFGEILGIPGRRSATWDATLSAAANGAAGIAPDCDTYLQIAFGKAATITAGTSVGYSFGDTCPSATIYDFNAPGTVTQFAILGAICQKFSATFGADVPMLNFSGEAMWVFDTIQLADPNTETIAKGGIAALVEPAAPVVNGTPPQGFSGVITLDGNVYSTLRTATVQVDIAREVQKDGFNVYPVAPGAGTRSISFNAELYDDDSPALNSLKTAALSPLYPVKTLMFQIGTAAGNKWTWTAHNVRLVAPTYDKQNSRRTVKFTGKAHDTSIGSGDALSLVIS
ncbi:MAG TPA: hypothetical protein VGF49_06170 [Candidatus Solibacter sp.]|jgi:hypothetical protein